MSTLHIINQPSGLASCLGVAGDQDTVLLIADAVYAAARPDAPARILYVLEDDVRARGLSARLGSTVKTIEYTEFVDLVEKHDRSVSWR